MWVILCRLPEKRKREIEEIVEEMKERDKGDTKLLLNEINGYEFNSTKKKHKKSPFYTYYKEQVNQNCADPDQTTSGFGASDLSLHHFPLIQQFWTHPQVVW